jgi:hypothetical protein
MTTTNWTMDDADWSVIAARWPKVGVGLSVYRPSLLEFRRFLVEAQEA